MEQASQKPPARRRRSRHGSAVDQVRRTDFPIVLRGYDREAVDAYVAQVAQLVAELEATQTREGVVQRALDEVGEQTSGILQHAHDTAEEIAARSRSQAEGRLQRAEQEADETRREADRYAEQMVEDTRRLWEDRQRMIEDMRQLADEVLGVADDALDRLEQPNTEFAAPPVEGQEPMDAEPGADPAATEAWELPEEADDTPAESVIEAPAVDEAADQAADEHATSELETPAARKRGK